MRILLAMHADSSATALSTALPAHRWSVRGLSVPNRIAHDASSPDQRIVADFRERLRRQLDQAVAEFNPHLIHAEGLTFWGQLASETGVPYVATLLPADLGWREEQGRLRQLAEQGAENARRILVPAGLAAAGENRFGALDHAIEAAWWPLEGTAGVRPVDPEALDALISIYAAALGERSA